ncbi:SIR2 family protein [Pseudovibrio sp. POLY-S9]|uniref:SIR2 family protein n=1 Tax=Pseudovibrio sp. POLY-S9 TaxID=1576596 RepID=UPI000710D6A7|nr:SIR2 family protein [Pseudovibrio sp. POLY-S9]
MKKDIKLFVDAFLKEVQAQNAAVFLGAGASVPAGFVDWKELLTPVAQELSLDIELESDLVALAQFHVNSSGMNRHVVSQAILDALGRNVHPTENHKLLAKLPISTFWTTNYDSLIETSIRDEGKIADIKHSVKQLANTRSKRDAVVYKMHGDVEHPQDAIITKDDYEKYYRTHGAFINTLSGDLVSKTFVFIGFSFSDPNLDYILSRVRVTFENHQRRHFAFFRKRQKMAEESEAEFKHASVRQNLMIEDLKRFNIKALLVDDYSEITQALEEIVRQYRANTIFVSSSASVFEPWGEKEVVTFMRQLGSMLIDDSFRVATGLGLGVGNALFTGSLEQVYRSLDKHIDEHLLIRPFPQFVDDDHERQKLWEDYRRGFIPSAGIALFLFGNKLDNERVINADGMLREFEIAAENGLVLLPVGATGYTAKLLADRLISDPSAFPSFPRDLLPKVVELSKPVKDLRELLQPIKDLLTFVRKK